MQVIKRGIFSMQVCVPRGTPDSEVITFAESENPSGTNGWFIRKQGDKALAGKDERVTCAECNENVHIMLDA